MSVARSHRPRLLTGGLWLVGLLVVFSVPMALCDPAMIALLLDPDLLVIMTAAGFGVVRGNFRNIAQYARHRIAKVPA